PQADSRLGRAVMHVKFRREPKRPPPFCVVRQIVVVHVTEWFVRSVAKVSAGSLGPV
ncbi:hypothetical protein TNCV_4068961, partial [Trichonephila clavipes]